MTTPPSASPLKVTFTLIEGDDEFAQRTLLLQPETDITLGRSSKDTTKQLVATVDNLWLQSPVVSRKHARLAYRSQDGEPPKLTIEDIGSSHGTYIGDQACHARKLYPVVDGDILKFGADVIRGEDSFAPPSFRVDTSTMPPKAVAIPVANAHSYSFPEDWSDFSSHAPSSTESVDGDVLAGASHDSSDDEEPDSDVASSASQRIARLLTDNVVEILCASSSPPNPTEGQISEERSSSPLRCPAADVSLQSFLHTHPTFMDLPRLFPETVPQPVLFDDRCPYSTSASHPDEIPSCDSCNTRLTTNVDDKFIEPTKLPRPDWSSIFSPSSENIQPASSTTRGNVVKNGISIESLINRPGPATTVPEVAAGKRKLSDVNEDDLVTEPQYMHSRGSSLVSKSAQVEHKEEFLAEVETGESSEVGTRTVPTQAVGESPRKRSRLGDVALGLTCFVAGGISAVGALASLPDTFFS